MQFLGACYGCRLEIGHDIDDWNTTESDHLLEFDVPAVIAVHVRYRRSKVRPVPVQLEEVAPVRSRWLGRHPVREDRIGARLKGGVRLFTYRWLSKCERESKQAYMFFWSHRGGEMASGKDAAVQGDLQAKRAQRGQIPHSSVPIPRQLGKKETHLSDDEVLRELGKISSNILVRFLCESHARCIG
jgi:hypothetical protein